MKKVLPNFPPFAPRVFNEDNVYIEEFIKLIQQYMHQINLKYAEVIAELSHLQIEKKNPKKDILDYIRTKQLTTQKTKAVSEECVYLR